MAEADTSRTLSFVTRRTLLRLAMATLGPRASAASPAREGEDVVFNGGDPALALWRDWQAANRKTRAFGRLQARLESQLVKAVGFPQIRLRPEQGAQSLVVSTIAEIERVLGSGSEKAAEREKARTELVARQTAWNEADARVGYTRARQAETDAQEREEVLLDMLWTSRAQTCAGVAGKLHAILAMGEPREGSDEFPWPQIRGVLADLLHIAA